jgi:hypothetical protein
LVIAGADHLISANGLEVRVSLQKVTGSRLVRRIENLLASDDYRRNGRMSGTRCSGKMAPKRPLVAGKQLLQANGSSINIG